MELLNKLTMCFGPSGREENIRELIKSEAEKYADEIYTDTLGNLIVRKGNGGKKIVILAHMDEIGIVVTYKDDKGFLRFAPVGGLKTKDLVGRRVVFSNGAIGVIGVHDEAEKYEISKMFIDIAGYDSINVGDMAVFTLKNTSKETLTVDAEELMGRFVRGDKSRNTEGSGLGLSIAQSLTEIQGGLFELYVDGDLFRVTLQFPVAQEVL